MLITISTTEGAISIQHPNQGGYDYLLLLSPRSAWEFWAEIMATADQRTNQADIGYMVSVRGSFVELPSGRKFAFESIDDAENAKQVLWQHFTPKQ